MSDYSPVHLCPPAGSDTLPCCGRTVDQVLAAMGQLTTFAHQVTCAEREMAELVVDTDDGESPFGWREDETTERAPALATALRAVRRQCIAWTRPPTSSSWNARNRDLGVAVAARALLDIIDRLVPGLDDADPEEAAQLPHLVDRFAAVLVTTVRSGFTGQPPPRLHGTGHFYDGRCALCTGDVDALADALVQAVTRTPLPHLGGRQEHRRTRAYKRD